MILTFLFGFIVLISLFQPNIRRKFAAFVFIGVAIAHDHISISWDNSVYYLSAALFNLLVIIITSSISPIPKMVVKLQRICLGFVLVNGFGLLSELLPWVEWFHGGGYNSVSVLVYNNAMIVLYCLTLLNFIDMTPDERERGNNLLDIRRHLRFNLRSLFYCISGNGDKI
jgi:hypothetical protein